MTFRVHWKKNVFKLDFIEQEGNFWGEILGTQVSMIPQFLFQKLCMTFKLYFSTLHLSLKELIFSSSFFRGKEWVIGENWSFGDTDLTPSSVILCGLR